MTLRNAQPPLGPIEIDSGNIIGLRKRNDGSTVILQSIEPTHIHVRDPFPLVCKFLYEELQAKGGIR